ncbi:anthranilate synthase, component II /aminodeoxychorismate synthase, glutamine amidotransferase subunit [Lysobacter sp. yr284]|uniref:anthranilate synthase component II n=1 Tax=Lysobacter TaxID=68 RepID=UPI00089A54BA|nr:aminodeoxychorismate/anthranilate synthase component II [Lysobacter sp. yr284]SDY35823.1 anthranilate synthase, component II /aminodeoxychorismate synthase, glutamine amidotransferase subunit [Lysobacter sp. yr284]
MLLLIDNFDSFTYNLVQVLGKLGAKMRVVRNDAIGAADIEAMQPDHILISPGPCTPNEAGISMEVIRRFGGRIPILGVCLGHQAIGQAYGGRVVRAPEPVHGKTAAIHHNDSGVFSGLPSGFSAARYHSLMVAAASLPDCLEITAWHDGIVMGIRHRELAALEGVQFHPESFLTPLGSDLLANFLDYAIPATQQWQRDAA